MTGERVVGKREGKRKRSKRPRRLWPDVVITSRKHLNELEARNRELFGMAEANRQAALDLNFLKSFPETQGAKLLQLLGRSKAQCRQDLFVLAALEFERNGFFVEFGAADGVNLSNTYLLEVEFGWQGILAEPARCWHSALYSKRRASIETDCVWRATGETLLFREVAEAELSTLEQYSSADHHHQRRLVGQEYNVRTISLVDLLDKYGAPTRIDYLSIDTEGSEYEILKHFDFDKYSFRVITCEHNFTGSRELIYKLLTSNGYERRFEEISQFDDWYVRRR